jgi:hypothetical protein
MLEGVKIIDDIEFVRAPGDDKDGQLFAKLGLKPLGAGEPMRTPQLAN